MIRSQLLSDIGLARDAGVPSSTLFPSCTDSVSINQMLIAESWSVANVKQIRSPALTTEESYRPCCRRNENIRFYEDGEFLLNLIAIVFNLLWLFSFCRGSNEERVFVRINAGHLFYLQ